jgi:hypothetical protein
MGFVAGLDLGQSQDYSALALLEVRQVVTGGRVELRQDLRHLHRWELQTSYPTIVSDLRALLMRPELQAGCMLVVDGTGVGRPVVDYLRQQGLRSVPVTITGGDAVTRDEGGWWHVPKRDLVSVLAVGFETGSLRIAEGLEYGPVLRKELTNFRAKISVSGHDSYEAWRENDHDDVLLALALACWLARRARSAGVAVAGPPQPRFQVAGLPERPLPIVAAYRREWPRL